MARFSGDRSGSETNSENIIQIADGQTQVSVADDSYIRDADFSREGMDLVIEGPDGTVVIEDYFASIPQPAITSPNGLTLTPNLVESFSESPMEFANAGLAATDISPVGAVQEISGEATVTRLDGTIEPVSIGTPIFQGDIVETNDQGAVNIMFIDETSFAISEDARLAIDEYVFDPATQAGTTNFSVLKGVFVFTSGLIGREDPDDVTIETPVGSIGIRGTIIMGDVVRGEITVAEGAIVLTDFNGNQMTLAGQFETAQFDVSGTGGGIQNLGILSPADVVNKFAAVSNVSGGLFSSFADLGAGNQGGDNAGQGGNQGGEPGQNPDGQGPDGQGPDGENLDGQGSDGQGPDGENMDGQGPDGGPDGENADGQGPDGGPDGENADGQGPDGGPDGQNADGQGPDGGPDGQNADGPQGDGPIGDGPAGDGPIGDGPRPDGGQIAGGQGPDGPGPDGVNADSTPADGPQGDGPVGDGMQGGDPNAPADGTAPSGDGPVEGTAPTGDAPADGGQPPAGGPLPPPPPGGFGSPTGTNTGPAGGTTGGVLGPAPAPTGGTASGPAGPAPGPIAGADGGDNLNQPPPPAPPEVIEEQATGGTSGPTDPSDRPQAFMSVGEEAVNTTLVGSIFASTPVLSPGTSFAISGGNTDGVFAISPLGNVRIVNNTNLDFEGTSQYVLTVNQLDIGGNIVETGTVTIDITDFGAAISASSPSVAENLAPGSLIADISSDVTSHVGGASSITGYEILGGDGAALFDIDSVGKITLKAGVELDHEAAGNHSLDIRFTDDQGEQIVSNYTINVTDVDSIPDTTPSYGDLGIKAPFDLIQSGSPTIIGIDNQTDIQSSSNVEYSVNGGSFVSGTNGINEGETLQIQMRTPGLGNSEGEIQFLDQDGNVAHSETIMIQSSASRLPNLRLDLTNDSVLKITDDIGNGFGDGFAAVGDLNGDGFDDLLFTRSSDKEYFQLNGKAGTMADFDIPTVPGNFSTQISSILASGAADNATDMQITAIGDFDGDGDIDYALSVPNGDANAAGTGQVQIIDASGTVLIDFQGLAAGDEFGFSISNVGDVNGDGYDDLIIGAPMADTGGKTDSGEVHLIFGRGTISPTETLDVSSLSASDGLSFSDAAPAGGENWGNDLSGIGDFDNDGYADFAFAIAGSNQIKVVLGDSNAGNISSGGAQEVTFTNLAAGNSHIPIFNAGDFDGDGVSDMAIFDRAADTGKGELIIAYGDSGVGGSTKDVTDTLFNGVKVRATGSTKNIVEAGMVGDFNGDGFDDVVVAFKGPSGSDKMVEFYVIHGGNDSSILADGIINYNELNNPDVAFRIDYEIPANIGDTNTFDFDIYSAGDINGDGFDDLAIGTPGVDNDSGANSDSAGGTNDDSDGAAYIVYGRMTNSFSDYVIDNGTGPSANNKWDFEEVSGTTIADSLGGNNFTFFGEASVQSEPGEIGNAIAFDGVDDYAVSANDPGISNSSFSIVVDVRRNSTGAQEAILSSGTTGLNTSLFFGFDASDNIVIDFGGNKLYTSHHSATSGEWTSYVITYDSTSGTRSVFADGELILQDIISSDFAGTGPLTLGRSVDGTDYFNGAIDNLGIGNAELQPTDIQLLYANREDADSSAGVVAASEDHQSLIGSSGNDTLAANGKDALAFNAGAGDDVIDLGNMNTGFDAVNINNPAATNSFEHVFGDDFYIYAIDGVGAAATITAFDHDGIFLTSFSTNTANTTDIWSDGQYIYLARSADGLTVLDFDGSSFSSIDTIAGNIRGVSGDDDYIYAGDSSNNIQAYTFDGSTLSTAGSAFAVGGTFSSIHVDEYTGDIFVTNNADVQAFTFDGSSFTAAGTDTGGAANIVDVATDAGYVFTAGNADGITAYTYDGSTFTNVGTYATSGPYTDVWAENGYIFGTRGANGVAILEFDGSNFTEIGSVADASKGVWSDGSHIYVADNGNFESFDIKDNRVLSIDGGSGTNDFIEFSSDLDLSQIGSMEIKGIEGLRMTGTVQTLTIGMDDIFKIMQNADNHIFKIEASDVSARLDFDGNGLSSALAIGNLNTAAVLETALDEADDGAVNSSVTSTDIGGGVQEYTIGGYTLQIDQVLIDGTNAGQVI